MNTEKTYLVFGYGSLMNDQSRLRSAPQSVVVTTEAVLQGYQRIFNVAYGEYVYANVQPVRDQSVTGTVMRVTEIGYTQLLERERNYDLVDITKKLAGEWDEKVYAFIGSDNTVGTEVVKQSYIDLCLSGVPEGEREQWIVDTEIPYGIYDDVHKSV